MKSTQICLPFPDPSSRQREVSFAAEAVAKCDFCVILRRAGRPVSFQWLAFPSCLDSALEIPCHSMRSQADWTVAAWINPSVTPMLPVSLVVKKEYASSENSTLAS